MNLVAALVIGSAEVTSADDSVHSEVKFNTWRQAELMFEAGWLSSTQPRAKVNCVWASGTPHAVVQTSK